MRFIFKLIVIGLLIYAGTTYYHSWQDERRVCRSPLTYQIGAVDASFNISRSEVVDALLDAEALWEKGTDRDLFAYATSSAAVTVNFVFDERQAETNLAETLRTTLASQKDLSDSVREKYAKLIDEYENIYAAYGKQADAYETRLAAYNDEVEKWNNEGGAPKGVYDTLQKEAAELSDDRDTLNNLVEQLNTLATEINTLGEKGSELIEMYNTFAENYNERFGDGEEFTQGEYQSKTVTIYEYKSQEELRLVLAHELGHALGLNHVDGERSIMYYLMGAQSLVDGITKNDIAAVSVLCGMVY